MTTYGSVCSGIEAATAAWHPLGWVPAWFAEIEKFPSAVLAHHYPDVPNLGDMTTIARRVLTGAVEAPDVLVGGTPCQAFSVAGLREGLDDARGQLTISYMRLADATDFIRQRAGKPPAIIVWENVPGALSDKTNAFGCFLAGLAGENCELKPAGKRWSDAGCVYGPKRAIAWRILDAQYFGLAQRRRRVFVIASARNDFDPARVLFEFDGVRRDSPPSREAGKDVAGTLESRTGAGGFPGTDGACSGHVIAASTGDISHCLNAGGMGRQDFETETIVVHGTQDPCTDEHVAFALGRNSGRENAVCFAENSRGEVRLEGGHGSRAGSLSTGGGKPGQGTPVVCITGEVTHALKAEGFDASEDGTGRGQPIVAFSCKDHGADAADDLAPTLRAMNHSGSHANAGGQVATMYGSAVRRLTPVECERLMGFPDNYTLIPLHNKKPSDVLRFSADDPRYKALGNSMAVPCMRWIGARIAAAFAQQWGGNMFERATA